MLGKLGFSVSFLKLVFVLTAGVLFSGSLSAASVLDTPQAGDHFTVVYSSHADERAALAKVHELRAAGIPATLVATQAVGYKRRVVSPVFAGTSASTGPVRTRSSWVLKVSPSVAEIIGMRLRWSDNQLAALVDASVKASGDRLAVNASKKPLRARVLAKVDQAPVVRRPRLRLAPAKIAVPVEPVAMKAPENQPPLPLALQSNTVAEMPPISAEPPPAAPSQVAPSAVAPIASVTEVTATAAIAVAASALPPQALPPQAPTKIVVTEVPTPSQTQAAESANLPVAVVDLANGLIAEAEALDAKEVPRVEPLVATANPPALPSEQTPMSLTILTDPLVPLQGDSPLAAPTRLGSGQALVASNKTAVQRLDLPVLPAQPLREDTPMAMTILSAPVPSLDEQIGAATSRNTLRVTPYALDDASRMVAEPFAEIPGAPAIRVAPAVKPSTLRLRLASEVVPAKTDATANAVQARRVAPGTFSLRSATSLRKDIGEPTSSTAGLFQVR